MEHGILPKNLDYLSQAVVLYCLITFSLEPYHSTTKDFFYYSEIIVTVFFAAEYFYRIYLAKDKWAYIAGFFGVIDLLSFLPFMVSLGMVDFRFIRIIRLLRLLRLMKFVRYSKSVRRLRNALLEIRGELITFTFITCVMVYISSVGIFYFEHEAQPEKYTTVAESMWWAICTLSTVGYGDVYPVTVGGRFFTTIILIIGLGFIAIPSGLIASALANNKES